MEPLIAVTARCEIRAVIRFLHAKKLQPVEIHRQLSKIYGETCISIQHVCKWCREFSEGRTDIHDEKRSGRPSISDEVVAKIERTKHLNRRRAISIDKEGNTHRGHHMLYITWTDLLGIVSILPTDEVERLLLHGSIQ
ncbi:hypothetical protein NQ318_009050 [Aromia moschata]|uniref:Mos1 transposase HTH domain-containing protein n=1 Tax=Aromia moschata TaxID=1265417 RepID=A0AAV8YUH7_9CUCU|nr:hypothetical protein NQ318_009050 [Aromia moschata]